VVGPRAVQMVRRRHKNPSAKIAPHGGVTISSCSGTNPFGTAISALETAGSRLVGGQPVATSMPRGLRSFCDNLRQQKVRCEDGLRDPNRPSWGFVCPRHVNDKAFAAFLRNLTCGRAKVRAQHQSVCRPRAWTAKNRRAGQLGSAPLI